MGRSPQGPHPGTVPVARAGRRRTGDASLPPSPIGYSGAGDAVLAATAALSTAMSGAAGHDPGLVLGRSPGGGPGRRSCRVREGAVRLVMPANRTDLPA